MGDGKCERFGGCPDPPGFNIMVNKYYKMSVYWDKLITVTLLPFPNNVKIPDLSCSKAVRPSLLMDEFYRQRTSVEAVPKNQFSVQSALFPGRMYKSSIIYALFREKVHFSPKNGFLEQPRPSTHSFTHPRG